MELDSLSLNALSSPMAMRLGIVGGGKTCRFLLLRLRAKDPFFDQNIKIDGVIDKDPDAEGIVLAGKMGIFTGSDYRDLFKIDDLDGIVLLEDDKDLLLDIIREKPDHIGIIDAGMGMQLASILNIRQKQNMAKQQEIFEKMTSEILFRQTNAAILVLDTNFRIVDANEAYLKAVDKAKEDVIGKYCYRITRGLDAPPCEGVTPGKRCPMVETLRTGQTTHIIHEIPGLDDQMTYWNTVTYPLKDHNGDIVRVIELQRDITNEISSRWEKQIKTLKANMSKSIQEDRMISLGKLAASCVHEINNPIQGLLTFSDLMQDMLSRGQTGKKDLEKFKKYLTLMSHELERCGNIVSGLLSFSRENPMEYKNVLLNETLDSVITLTQHKMELQNIRLTTQISSRPLVIVGDSNQLQQCFLNLIFNSIEAMSGGGELKVIADLEPDGKSVRVEVCDTGHGIQEENMDHIFDPFFTTKEQGEGTGLGLSIVYGVTKNHRGEIKVTSKPGQGACFILYFPIYTTEQYR